MRRVVRRTGGTDPTGRGTRGCRDGCSRYAHGSARTRAGSHPAVSAASGCGRDRAARTSFPCLRICNPDDPGRFCLSALQRRCRGRLDGNGAVVPKLLTNTPRGLLLVRVPLVLVPTHPLFLLSRLLAALTAFPFGHTAVFSTRGPSRGTAPQHLMCSGDGEIAGTRY